MANSNGTVPIELNKKNGRPKVLTAQQELVHATPCPFELIIPPSLTPQQEVRDWLRAPQNRSCYLDDLVWLLHDRFGIVCSTTTMSKLKRKWLQVIDYEETGLPLDAATRTALRETHPGLYADGVEIEGGEREVDGDRGFEQQVLDPAMGRSEVGSLGVGGLPPEGFAGQPGLGEDGDVENEVERELGVAGPSGV